MICKVRSLIYRCPMLAIHRLAFFLRAMDNS